jgi:hypothetical protein
VEGIGTLAIIPKTEILANIRAKFEYFLGDIGCIYILKYRQ